MSRGDLLLQWVSCHQELRSARVQAAAERLCAPPAPLERDDPRLAPYLRAAKRLMRNLLRLGHVEEVNPIRFRTVPPTIFFGTVGRNTLVGARSDAVREGLSKFPGVSVRCDPSQPEGPAMWFVTGTDSAIAAAATSLGFALARDRGPELLASLPCLATTLQAAPPEAIPDRIEWWNPDVPVGRQRWSRPREGTHAQGLYRTLRKPHQWYLRAREGEPTVRLDSPERRVAAAWLLRRGAARLAYSESRRALAIPAIGFGLPLLVDRTLILPSGRLPEWAPRTWTYSDIDPDRARHAARIVGAPLEVTP